MKSRKSQNWDRLIGDSCTYLTAQQEVLERLFKIGSYKRYDWDMGTGQIVFSDAGVPIVVASIQFVGTIATRGGTWLWSWGNESIHESVKSRILDVRAFGEEHGYDKLVTPLWYADEVDGWEMTSIAANLLKAKGAYRTPETKGFTFLIMTDVRWFLSAVPER